MQYASLTWDGCPCSALLHIHWWSSDTPTVVHRLAVQTIQFFPRHPTHEHRSRNSTRALRLPRRWHYEVGAGLYTSRQCCL